MKRNKRTAFNQLKKIGVPVFIHQDAEHTFDINAEDPESYRWVNYWESPSTWEFGVHPTIDKILYALGLHCEWMNPGHLRVFE
jgi:hypothetical protein